MAFYDILVIIALILWILIGTGILVTLVLVTPRLLRTLAQIDDVSDVMVNRMLPVLERSDGVVDQVGRLVDAALADMELVDRTVVRATDSVERMLEVAEERVSEVNALLSVAIEEAEDTFLSTAGLLRAVRGGRRRGRRKRKSRWLQGGARSRLRA
ncbi:MAG: hypothetical protein R6X22_12775 [Gemmatimonadota bacterium]